MDLGDQVNEILNSNVPTNGIMANNDASGNHDSADNGVPNDQSAEDAAYELWQQNLNIDIDAAQTMYDGTSAAVDDTEDEWANEEMTTFSIHGEPLDIDGLPDTNNPQGLSSTLGLNGALTSKNTPPLGDNLALTNIINDHAYQEFMAFPISAGSLVAKDLPGLSDPLHLDGSVDPESITNSSGTPSLHNKITLDHADSDRNYQDFMSFRMPGEPLAANGFPDFDNTLDLPNVSRVEGTLEAEGPVSGPHHLDRHLYQAQDVLRGLTTHGPTDTLRKLTESSRVRKKGPTQKAAKAKRPGGSRWTEKERAFVLALERKHSTGDEESVKDFNSLMAEYNASYGHKGRSKRSVSQKTHLLRKAQGLPPKHGGVNIGGTGVQLKRKMKAQRS